MLQSVNNAFALLIALALFGSATAEPSAGAPGASRLATMADARAVRAIGQIGVSPDGELIAVEEEGGIVIRRTDRSEDMVYSLDGSTPIWSPDGNRLAYFTTVAGQPQVAIWTRGTDDAHPVTDFPWGVTPNPFASFGNYRSFSWSPDSRRIAFVSRRMPGYRATGKLDENSRITVFTTEEFSKSAPLAGVIHDADAWAMLGKESFGPDLAPPRMRAIEKRPEFRFNHLFIVDVVDKAAREIKTAREPFYPAWSPDGQQIAILTEAPGSQQPEFGWLPELGNLLLVDVDTQEETAVPTPWRMNGVPRWSPDGALIAIVAQRRRMGFAAIQIYDIAARRWSQVQTDGNKSVVTNRRLLWYPGSHELLYTLADRFADSLWAYNPGTEISRAIHIGELQLGSLDCSDDGRLFFSASGPKFLGRIYSKPVEEESTSSSEPPRLLYDSNPQLQGIRFGEQRKLTWRNSAGEEVDGIAILPPDYDATRHYPVLVDVYPRRARNILKFVASSQVMGQLAAARGYVVFLPQLRAPHGAYVFSQDEAYTEKARGVAGVDIMLDDLRTGLEYLVATRIADSDRVCLFGHSNGGYSVNLIITRSDIGRCAIISAGLSSLLYPVLGADPPGTREERTNGNLYENFAHYVELSPLFRMDRVRVPVLMLSGDHDWDWTLQMIAQFGSLRLLDKDVTWVRYKDEGHFFSKPENVDDSFERIMKFVGDHIASVAPAAEHSTL